MSGEDGASDGSRIERLETRVARLQVGLAGLAVLLLGVGATAAGLTSGPGAFSDASAGDEEVVRAHRVVVVDSTGQNRIVLGAPLGTPGRRSPVTGIRVNGADGAEQLGMGVDAEGGVGIGLDARPGAAEAENRERINLVVDPDGRAQLRFLDNRSRVQGRFRTGATGEHWYEFLEWSDGDVTAHHRLDEAAVEAILHRTEGGAP